MLRRIPIPSITAILALFCCGAELRVTTEYMYPTEYDAVQMPGVARNDGGWVMPVGVVVIPRSFETRTVGVTLSVDPIVYGLENQGLAAAEQSKMNGLTTLMIATTSGDLNGTTRSINRGARVNVRDRSGATALIGAAAGGCKGRRQRSCRAHSVGACGIQWP